MGKTKKKEKGMMPKWFPFAWSTRGVSLSLNIVLVGYITYYCTDMLGMRPAIVGALFLASKLVDGVTDMLVGFIVEKTHTKWGKGRPYEFAIIFTWIFTVLLFNVPDVGRTAQYVYLFIMYMLVNSICITMLQGAETVYLVNAVKTKGEQVKTISISGSIIMLAAIIFNMVLPQVINTLGATKSGWPKIMLMFCIPLAVIGMLRFLLCREQTEDAETEKKEKDSLSVKEMFRLMFTNKYTWILVGMVVIINLINNLSLVTTYYFKYIIGDIGLASLPAMASILTPFVLMLFPALCKKWGTTNLLRAGIIISIAGIIVRMLGGASLVTIVIGTAFFTIGVMPITMLNQSYTIDTMDYGEWKNGKRIEGPLSSMVSLSIKIGTALASGITGLVMEIAGYNGELETQTDTAMSAIGGLYNLCPLILLVITLVLAILWNLDKQMPKIREELDARRK